MTSADTLIRDLAALGALYGQASPRSLAKEIDHLSDAYRAFAEKAPFVVVATAGPEGLDCSPRGDPPGFVRVADRRTILIPDRPGNNRVDSLRNIVRDPRIALLFLVPGVGETLRINGRAEIDADPALCHSFAVNGKAARSVVRVRVESAYFQCAKALVRSSLWDREAQAGRAGVPTAGMMLNGLVEGPFDPERYDAENAGLPRESFY